MDPRSAYITPVTLRQFPDVVNPVLGKTSEAGNVSELSPRLLQLPSHREAVANHQRSENFHRKIRNQSIRNASLSIHRLATPKGGAHGKDASDARREELKWLKQLDKQIRSSSAYLTSLPVTIGGKLYAYNPIENKSKNAGSNQSPDEVSKSSLVPRVATLANDKAEKAREERRLQELEQHKRAERYKIERERAAEKVAEFLESKNRVIHKKSNDNVSIARSFSTNEDALTDLINLTDQASIATKLGHQSNLSSTSDVKLGSNSGEDGVPVSGSTKKPRSSASPASQSSKDRHCEAVQQPAVMNSVERRDKEVVQLQNQKDWLNYLKYLQQKVAGIGDNEGIAEPPMPPRRVRHVAADPVRLLPEEVQLFISNLDMYIKDLLASNASTGTEDIEKIKELIIYNYSTLKWIHSRFSVLGETNISTVFSLSPSQFKQLCERCDLSGMSSSPMIDLIFIRTCRDDAFVVGPTQRRKKGKNMLIHEFLEAIIRLSVLKYGFSFVFPQAANDRGSRGRVGSTLADAVEAFLSFNLLPLGNRDPDDTFRDRLSSSDVQHIFSELRGRLLATFFAFTGGGSCNRLQSKKNGKHSPGMHANANPRRMGPPSHQSHPRFTMSLESFVFLLRDCELIDKALSLRRVLEIFVVSNLDEDSVMNPDQELIFDEFLEALARCAVIKALKFDGDSGSTNGLTLAERLQHFLVKMFLPRVARLGVKGALTP